MPAPESRCPSRGAQNLSSSGGLTVWLLLPKVHAATSQEERAQLGSCQSQAIFSFISTQQGFNTLLLRVQSCGACSPLGVSSHAGESRHMNRRQPDDASRRHIIKSSTAGAVDIQGFFGALVVVLSPLTYHWQHLIKTQRKFPCAVLPRHEQDVRAKETCLGRRRQKCARSCFRIHPVLSGRVLQGVELMHISPRS